MGPANAIKTGLTKSFQLSGRATRSEFWWFAPIGILLALVISTVAAKSLNVSNVWGAMGVFVVTLIAFCPFMSVGSRRLQDTGENGQDIFLPLGPVLYAVICFGLLKASENVVFLSMMLWGLPFGFIGGIFGFFLGFLLLVIFIGLTVIFPIVGLLHLGPIIGQLLIPSEPGANRFGPNPNEVPS